jgi:signal recognition particle receptor subunit beta
VALINHRTHEIHFKIVYYGCGLCGKTTNLRSLHDRLPPERRGKLISIATDHERTLFFDFLPIDLGTVNGFLTRFHLYTVPGQVYYRLSRRAVLQGVDGIVFVADSHPSREQANLESLADLRDHLGTLGITGPALARIPWAMQWNKRDLPAALPAERLRAALNPQGWPEFEAVASDGRGVSETLRSICKAVLARLAPGAAPAHAIEAAPAVGAAAMPAPMPHAAAAMAAPGPAAVQVPAPAGVAAAPGDTARAPAPPRIAPASAPPAQARPIPRPAPRRASPPVMAAAGPLRTSRFPMPSPRPAMRPAPAADAPSRPAGPPAAKPAPPMSAPAPPAKPRSV